MEPMTLGSPVGGSASPNKPYGFSSAVPDSSNQMSSPYYPSYLMGESPSISNPRVTAGSISPGRRFSQYTPSNQTPQMQKDIFQSRLAAEKQSGPPAQSLLGGLPQSPASHLQNASFIDQSKIIGTPTNASVLQSPVYNYHSPIAPGPGRSYTPLMTPSKDINRTLNESCFDLSSNYQNDPLKNSWVTIYGFPTSSASYILTQFAQLGSIVEQKFPGLGNWMHVKFQTKLQARKALSKNGHIFNGSIMIGVVPCRDDNLLSREEKENQNMSLNASGFLSPCGTPRKEGMNTPKSNIRPLTQAYHAARADIEVSSHSNTPKKNEGIVSRAIYHLLGL